MSSFNLEAAVQVVASTGGLVALVLAALQAANTWLDIGEKLRKRRRAGKKGSRAG